MGNGLAPLPAFFDPPVNGISIDILIIQLAGNRQYTAAERNLFEDQLREFLRKFICCEVVFLIVPLVDVFLPAGFHGIAGLESDISDEYLAAVFEKSQQFVNETDLLLISQVMHSVGCHDEIVLPFQKWLSDTFAEILLIQMCAGYLSLRQFCHPRRIVLTVDLTAIIV